VLLLAGVAVAGESAAVPGLGPRTALPPWDAGLPAPSLLVTVLLALAYGLGALAVALGLRSLRHSTSGLAPRRVAAAGVAAVALLVVVPPLGSADHLSYVAYGRIAAAGDDPYLVPPDHWRGGRDPVAGAVQPPWQSAPSVYGPVATAVQGLVAAAGGGSLRRTVWFWQLVAGTAFLAVGAMLDRLTRHDPRARARAVVLWTLNPLLLGQLVLGAHLDVLAAALAVGVIALAARAPLVAGLLLGAAAGTKLPYAVVGLAAVWAVRRLPRAQLVRQLTWGAIGALAVLVPAHVWAGPHVFDQLGRAGRMVSLATPWRAVVDGAGLLVGSDTTRAVVTPAAGLLALWVAWRLVRQLPWSVRDDARAGTAPRLPRADRRFLGTRFLGVGSLGAGTLEVGPSVSVDGLDDRWVVTEAAGAAAVLSTAWVLTTPYALPWYDALVWAPLALVGASWLDGVLLLRLLTLAVAYVPGRVVGMSPGVEAVTLGVRSWVAPVVAAGVLVTVIRRTRPPARSASSPSHP
jgi:uncharacterized membrane protein YuzA (DUF378 family)